VKKRTCSLGSSRNTPVKCVVKVGGAGFPDAAHGHAQVLGLDHHGDPAGLEALVDRLGDLRRHGLLRLQPQGEHVHHRASFERPTTPAVG
jgi:hypothetical protein